MHITTPKTSAGCRTVPMLEEVRQALFWEKQLQWYVGCTGEKAEVDGYTDFVLMNRNGYVHNQKVTL
jgi:hypothetical protein